MNRLITLTIAVFLALSAYAHSFEPADAFYECQNKIDSVDCSSIDADSALGSGAVPQSENVGGKNSIHCQMHCAVFVELTVTTVAFVVRDHATFFKPIRLSMVGYVVPRPPNIHG